ncbi:MAG: hypothetical protein EBZ48_05570, partial [Proteobacteria bacterium]|nr:hypothetical protein [Pseudomonadota bacterium]
RGREGVRLAERVGKAFAERDQQVGLLELREQLCRGADTHVAGKVGAWATAAGRVGEGCAHLC